MIKSTAAQGVPSDWGKPSYGTKPNTDYDVYYRRWKI